MDQRSCPVSHLWLSGSLLSDGRLPFDVHVTTNVGLQVAGDWIRRPNYLSVLFAKFQIEKKCFLIFMKVKYLVQYKNSLLSQCVLQLVSHVNVSLCWRETSRSHDNILAWHVKWFKATWKGGWDARAGVPIDWSSLRHTYILSPLTYVWVDWYFRMVTTFRQLFSACADHAPRWWKRKLGFSQLPLPW